MRSVKIVNKYRNEDCYLNIRNTSGSFQLCDAYSNHIDGYFLFGITIDGMYRDEGVGCDEEQLDPIVDTDYDNNYTIKITGVDEL